MKLISWNVRGSNSQLKRRLLKSNIRIEKLAIVFLQETKCNMEELRNYDKFFWKGSEMVALDANGVAGGLGILQNQNLVSLSNFVASKNMLSGHFHILGTSIRGVITNVYDPFQLAQKNAFLEEIRNMGEWVGKDHWLMGRDFNIIRSLEEKKGGHPDTRWFLYVEK
jgi:exonuclease III